MIDRASPSRDGRQGTVLVYRDRIIPRSEASFLRRQYLGFTRLLPLWIGCRRDDGLKDLGTEPLILGRPGPLGMLDRALFKQFGILPRHADLAALQPRVIHAHFGRGGALALPIARALQIPLVVTFHGGDATKDKHYDRRLLPTIFQRRLAALQREAAIFICVSEHIRDKLAERGFPREKLRVIHYGIEQEGHDLPAPPPPSEPPYVLFVGRFVEKKGIPHLIEAMRLLERAGAKARLVLIGDGPLAEDLKKQAQGLAHTATFLGWAPNSEVRRWMRGALALAVPSIAARDGDAEGLPNVIIEAMAAGVPVIGSRHAGIGEAIEHGRTGFLVPPGDANALAAAIRELIDDPHKRHALGEAGQRRAAEHFDAVAQSRRLEETLLSVVKAI